MLFGRHVTWLHKFRTRGQLFLCASLCDAVTIQISIPSSCDGVSSGDLAQVTKLLTDVALLSAGTSAEYYYYYYTNVISAIKARFVK